MAFTPSFSRGGLEISLKIDVQRLIAPFTESQFHRNLILVACPGIVDVASDTAQLILDSSIFVRVLQNGKLSEKSYYISTSSQAQNLQESNLLGPESCHQKLDELQLCY